MVFPESGLARGQCPLLAASDRPGWSLAVRMVSDFGLLCHLQGIVNLNSQISEGALELCMPQQQLYDSEILRPRVDQRQFCAPQRVSGVLPGVQANPRYPRPHNPQILPRRHMRGASKGMSAVARGRFQ
jgi:hypothetical protein